MRKHIYLIIILVTLLSCTSRHAKEMLRTSMSLLDTQPELALTYLDSIKKPRQDFGREDFRQYMLTKVQAMYMTDRNIKYEDDIFEAQSYYNRKASNHKMIALSNLYSGCVLEEKDEEDQAMNAYKLAFEAAVTTDDSLIMGRIQQYMGRLLSSQGLHEKAIEAYRKAAYINKGMPEKQANNFSAIGRRYLIIGETDSAFIYFEKGIEKAKQSDRQQMLYQLYQNLSIAYRETGDYEKSEKYLRLSLQMNIDSSEITRYNLSFASLYLLMNKQDSCTYYENLLKKEMNTVKDEKLLASIYSFLSRKAVSENRYDSAYYQVKKCSELIEDITAERLKQSVFEIQQKYDYEKVQNEYNVKLLKRQKTIIMLVISVLFAAMFIIFIITRLLSKKKNEAMLKSQVIKLDRENAEIRYKQSDYANIINELKKNISVLEKKNSELTEQQQDNKVDDMIKSNNEKIDNIRYELSRLQERYDNNTSSLRNNLKQRVDMAYRIERGESLKTAGKEILYEKTKAHIFGSTDGSLSDALLKIFDDTYPGFAKKIRHEYADMNDTEFRVCVFSFLPLTVQDIADLLGQSVHNIGKSRTNIRKKIGMEDPGGDFCECIKQKLHY